MDGLKATMDRVKCERGRGVGRGDQENIIIYVWITNSIRTMQRMSGCEVCREGYLGDICHGWMNAKPLLRLQLIPAKKGIMPPLL